MAGNDHKVEQSSLIKIRTGALSASPRVQTVSASPSARDMEVEDLGVTRSCLCRGGGESLPQLCLCCRERL